MLQLLHDIPISLTGEAAVSKIVQLERIFSVPSTHLSRIAATSIVSCKQIVLPSKHLLQCLLRSILHSFSESEHEYNHAHKGCARSHTNNSPPSAYS